MENLIMWYKVVEVNLNVLSRSQLVINVQKLLTKGKKKKAHKAKKGRAKLSRYFFSLTDRTMMSKRVMSQVKLPCEQWFLQAGRYAYSVRPGETTACRVR